MDERRRFRRAERRFLEKLVDEPAAQREPLSCPTRRPGTDPREVYWAPIAMCGNSRLIL
jgi:hypothetical protein